MRSKLSNLLREEREEKWYEIQGVSFIREEDRDGPLSDFQTLISATQDGTLYVVSEDVIVDFEGKNYRTLDTRFYVKGDIPGVFYPQQCENPMKLRPKIVNEQPDYLITENGYAKVYVAYGFPAYLPEGFLYSTFGLAKEIAIIWKKIPTQKILTSLETSATRKSRIGGLSDASVVSNIEELINSIREGIDVVCFYLFFVVMDSNRQKLFEKGKELQNTLKAYGMEIESPRFYQSSLYEFKTTLRVFGVDLFTIKKTIADARSMRALFPLIKETFVDEEGVFLGFSGTGDPIVFNPYKRHNYLLLILGETGSGKSMSAKIYMRRLHEKFSIPVYGVDPESEYVAISGYFGSTGINLSEGKPLGLDPLKMGMDRSMISDILSEVYSVPPQMRPRLRKEIFSANSKDIFDFVNSCDRDLKKYLEPILTPPDRLVFEGNPPDMQRPLIFGLRNIRSTNLKILVTSLISIYLGQEMGRAVVFVDEGWLFIKTPRIMSVFENIARRGRKYGLHFIFITQRVEDVASTSEGRTLLEQAATAFLFRQEKEGVGRIRDIYKLSEGEIQYLVQASPGEGILKAGNTKVTIRIAATHEEMARFSTTPAVL